MNESSTLRHRERFTTQQDISRTTLQIDPRPGPRGLCLRTSSIEGHRSPSADQNPTTHSFFNNIPMTELTDMPTSGDSAPAREVVRSDEVQDVNYAKNDHVSLQSQHRTNSIEQVKPHQPQLTKVNPDLTATRRFIPVV
ncbi:hypothetical protein C7974DRAFT_467974 [Boeremia exigua]|uniref:uncharacterized protein n=1 Tax=Boeremia exigua TaxID=749465 RepID=UPI001E8D2E3E|nr:uncharacterized protein C7974DRAFT_467974 [Boeremia exigua]KAH6644319.1 hypothetical protein C7974DRAFT_467974 [Boeremia exigua]